MSVWKSWGHNAGFYLHLNKLAAGFYLHLNKLAADMRVFSFYLHLQYAHENLAFP